MSRFKVENWNLETLTPKASPIVLSEGTSNEVSSGGEQGEDAMLSCLKTPVAPPVSALSGTADLPLLEQGYEGWSVLIEHPEKGNMDRLHGQTSPESVKRAQWELAYVHGSFPQVFQPGMRVQFQAFSYTLLSLGINSLRVQAETPEAFYAESAYLEGETAAFQTTPKREERLHRRIELRQRSKHGTRMRRTLDHPQLQQERGPRLCYELQVRDLPRPLCDDLPSWARGGGHDGESPSLARSCYIQLYRLVDQQTQVLTSWHPFGDDQEEVEERTLPDHCKVVIELSDFPEVPVLSMTTEEAALLVQRMRQADGPAKVTFLAPASFLEDELREIIAPGVSLPDSFYRPAQAAHRIVSLEPGQHVAIPKRIATHPVEKLGVSDSTVECLQEAGISTLGEFLALEEDVLISTFTTEILLELFRALPALNALPQLAIPPYLEDSETQETTLTCLPQFERAFRLHERVYCQFEDFSVQEVTRVRGRKNEQQGETHREIQVLRQSDGEWVVPLRFWSPVVHRECLVKENHPHASARGFLRTDAPHTKRVEHGTPLHEVVYYHLTGTTYDDNEQGRLYLATVSTLVDRLAGRQSGAVHTVWLTRKQLGQSMRWERQMKLLDTLELRTQVHAFALQRGAFLPERSLREEKIDARAVIQQEMEEQYNRVPVCEPESLLPDPRSGEIVPRPLELFVSREDLHEIIDAEDHPRDALLTLVKRYIQFPEALPPRYHQPRWVLEELHDCLIEDAKHTRRLNSSWKRLFPGQPHPYTGALIRETVQEKPEVIGYQFIIGLLPTVTRRGFVLTPRRIKPKQSVPGPIVVKTPNYVPLEKLAEQQAKKKRTLKTAVA